VELLCQLLPEDPQLQVPSFAGVASCCGCREPHGSRQARLACACCQWRCSSCCAAAAWHHGTQCPGLQ
jgi:hypothetical protein